ncbi:AimR family lysis-lysogeny pheromone receptor [Bacillus thuringiensis]
MKSLHVEVCKLIDNRPGLTYASVAEAIGVSAQYMSKFKKNGTINFSGLLKLAKVLSLPDQNFRMTMSNFCLKVDTTELIKQGFEYAAITRDIELLKKLIEKYRDDRGALRSI